MVKASLIAAVGLICATMLAIGFGVVVPVRSAVGDVFDVLAVVSGVFLSGCLTANNVPTPKIPPRVVGPPEWTANPTRRGLPTSPVRYGGPAGAPACGPRPPP